MSWYSRMPKRGRRKCQHSDAWLGPLFAGKCPEPAEWHIAGYPQTYVLCLRHMLQRIGSRSESDVHPPTFCGGTRACRGWEHCRGVCDDFCAAAGPDHWSHVNVTRKLRKLQRTPRRRAVSA